MSHDLAAETMKWLTDNAKVKSEWLAAAPGTHDYLSAEVAQYAHAAACVRFVEALSSGAIKRVLVDERGTLIEFREGGSLQTPTDPLTAYANATDGGKDA